MKKSKFLSSQEMRKLSGGLYEPPDGGSTTGPGEADASTITEGWDPSWPDQCLVWDSDWYDNGTLRFVNIREKN